MRRDSAKNFNYQTRYRFSEQWLSGTQRNKKNDVAVVHLDFAKQLTKLFTVLSGE
jgi:hypothetical protein